MFVVVPFTHSIHSNQLGTQQMCSAAEIVTVYVFGHANILCYVILDY